MAAVKTDGYRITLDRAEYIVLAKKRQLYINERNLERERGRESIEAHFEHNIRNIGSLLLSEYSGGYVPQMPQVEDFGQTTL